MRLWLLVANMKPFGYICRYRHETYYRYFNYRWSDAVGSCGHFRHRIANATIWKRHSSVERRIKFLSYLETVPIYSDPRKTGDKALTLKA